MVGKSTRWVGQVCYTSKITDIITSSFTTRTGLVPPLQHWPHLVQSSGVGSSYTSPQSAQLAVFWDASSFFGNKDAFRSDDGFEISSLCLFALSEYSSTSVLISFLRHSIYSFHPDILVRSTDNISDFLAAFLRCTLLSASGYVPICSTLNVPVCRSGAGLSGTGRVAIVALDAADGGGTGHSTLNMPFLCCRICRFFRSLQYISFAAIS